MRFLAVGVVFLFALHLSAQNTTIPGTVSASSDLLAVSLAQKSMAAMTAGLAITDVTLNANVMSIIGSDSETGTATLMAKGTTESRIDLGLSGGTRSEVRNTSNGLPVGEWQNNNGAVQILPQHNCWTDAVWFFPPLSSIGQSANSTTVFKYIGQEQHGGMSTQHIRIYQAALPFAAVQRMSTMDVYLDPASYLPLAIAFQVHPDTDGNTNIPVEVRFANYQLVNGIRAPLHIQRLLNGTVVTDITVTNVAVNTGVSSSTFILP